MAIEEDSSDEEPKIVDEDAGPKNEDLDIRIVKGIDSPFPLKTAKEIENHAREAKKLMKKGAEEFKKRWENRDKEPRRDSAPLIEEIDTSTAAEAEKASKKTENKNKK